MFRHNGLEGGARSAPRPGRPRSSRTRRWQRAVGATSVIAAVIMIAAGCGSPSGSSAGGGSGTSASGTQHFNILFAPYWLDTFNQAFAKWFTAAATKNGDTVTVANPNAVLSVQLNALDSAIGSKRYSGIAWQPIDIAAETQVINQITSANIPQTLNGTDPAEAGTKVPVVNFDETNSMEQLVERAAKIEVADLHQHPRLVWFTNSPSQPLCVNDLTGLQKGLAAVDPQAKIVDTILVPNSTATTALNDMTDFLRRGISFNMVAACGDTMSMAVNQALVAAGRGKAVNKKPLTEVQISLDGTPPALQLLWSPTSSVMAARFANVEAYSTANYNMLRSIMTGKSSPTSGAQILVPQLQLTPDCAKWRAIVAAEYAGVKGITVPACPADFTYTGPGA